MQMQIRPAGFQALIKLFITGKFKMCSNANTFAS